MKTKFFISLLAVYLGVFFWGNFQSAIAGQALPADVTPEMIAKGKALFDAKEGLGVKYACILCHKQDKAVKKSAVEKAGAKLPVVINKYITTKSKGKALAADSAEMKALEAYIRYEHSK